MENVDNTTAYFIWLLGGQNVLIHVDACRIVFSLYKMLHSCIIPLTYLFISQKIDVESLLVPYDISANTEIFGIKANGVKKLQFWYKGVT